MSRIKYGSCVYSHSPNPYKYHRQNCGTFGFSECAYHEWCQKDFSFAAQSLRARAIGRMRIVDSILADKDWRARAWYLERTASDEYARTERIERANEQKPLVIYYNNRDQPLAELLNFPIQWRVLPLKIREWLGAESNRRHEDFQSSALPTELPSRIAMALPQHNERRVLIKAENAQRSMGSYRASVLSELY